MSRIFITAPFQQGRNRQEIEHLCSLVKEAGFQDFCFIRDVENYEKVFDDPHELMKRTAEEIGKSDYLLLDMTNKPTGRAVEAGIAYAMNKKVILIARKGTEIKDCVRGIATAIIEYEKIEDITSELKTQL
jgi:nucleoside 2-deoxyribosyltransferase